MCVHEAGGVHRQKDEGWSVQCVGTAAQHAKADIA